MRKKKPEKRRKKPKIECKPNPETIVHDIHDHGWTIVITNPQACRKTQEEMSR